MRSQHGGRTLRATRGNKPMMSEQTKAFFMDVIRAYDAAQAAGYSEDYRPIVAVPADVVQDMQMYIECLNG
jgi:hypothetical protein